MRRGEPARGDLRYRGACFRNAGLQRELHVGHQRVYECPVCGQPRRDDHGQPDEADVGEEGQQPPHGARRGQLLQVVRNRHRTGRGAFTGFLGTLNNCVSSVGQVVTGGFAGHCDWRLPTIVELRTIIATSSSPAVDPVFNTGCTVGCTVTTCSCTAASYYWSSTS